MLSKTKVLMPSAYNVACDDYVTIKGQTYYNYP